MVEMKLGALSARASGEESRTKGGRDNIGNSYRVPVMDGGDRPMFFLSLRDQGAYADDRVIDELGKFVAHLRADFVVGPANQPIRGRETGQIGHGLDIPDDDAGWHRSTTGAAGWRFGINKLRSSELYLGSCRAATA